MRISTIKQRSVRDVRRRRRSKPSAIPKRSNDSPSITPHFSETSEDDMIVVDCKAGIAQITIVNGANNKTETYDCSLSGQNTKSVTFHRLDFDESVPLRFGVLGCNGRVKKVANVWQMACRDFVQIDRSKIMLRKQSAIGTCTRCTDESDDNDDAKLEGHKWAVLLNEKGPDGKLSRAITVDLRVGAILDGAVIYYEDGHKTPCGLRYTQSGSAHYFGGGNSQKLHIPQDVDIVKVEVKLSGWDHKILGGITMTLSDGTKAGALNTSWFTGSIFGSKDIRVLEPGLGEKIVGFYGTSSHYTEEFGIITAPQNVDLPSQAYDMPQLQNVQARDWAKNK
ncbi:hypothetical protein E4T39_03822 [Aureobasidium subglaciale]|nr:hypothetical protein E4T39_03822 [Aureobasidium subglaciale]